MLLFFSACTETKKSEFKQQNHTIVKLNNAKSDSCKHLLSNACIVLRRGNDVISEMFSQLNMTDKSYSHCGIALKENDKWFVYHSIGGEDNPDAILRKDSFEQFIRADHNMGFGICQFPLSKEQATDIQQKVHEFYEAKIPFDMKFDLTSNDRLYCAEMVYKAYKDGLKQDSFFNLTNHKGFVYVSTDNIFINKQAKMLCRVTY